MSLAGREAAGTVAKPVIAVDAVSRAFEIYRRPSDVLVEMIVRRPRHDVFWALRDVTLDVREGQRVGVIGPNGSGKTTLLKIITGHLRPTTGRVTLHGKISSLLNLSAAFNPERSGIDNIRLNLLLKGCPRSEINDHLEDIVEFTELGPFIYNPIRTFSSGMMARLSFAITTSIDPEILVVDEVLSVGDAYFVGKALTRMKELCDRGKALIFVSHDLGAVQRLCDTVVWLDQGEIREHGSTSDVLAHYELDYRVREDRATRKGHMQLPETVLPGSEELANPGIRRFRLVASEGVGRFRDTHFVRRLVADADDGTPATIELGVDDLFTPERGAGVDTRESEWGRSYERLAVRCRLLFDQSRRRRGGHFLVEIGDKSRPVTIACETSSLGDLETLAVEHLDVVRGEWLRLLLESTVDLERPWKRLVFRGAVDSVTHEQSREAVKRLLDAERPAVEIEAVRLVVDKITAATAQEGEPFDLEVRLIARRRVPRLDVGIRLMRGDGVYAFWQTSAWERGDIEDLEGEATVTFHFTTNYFSAGEYHVTVYCANGWDLQNNYPYSEVFDRRINMLTFRILPAHPGLDFGQVNARVPVSISRRP